MVAFGWKKWDEDIREDAQVYFRPTSKLGYVSWMEPVVEKPHKLGIVNWTDFDTIEEITASDYEERYGSSPHEDDDCCTFDATALRLAVRQMNSAGRRQLREHPTTPISFPEWLPVAYQPFVAEIQFVYAVEGFKEEDYGKADFPLMSVCKVERPLGVFVLPELPSKREQYPMMDSLLKFAEHKAVKEGRPKCFFEAHYGIEDDLWRLEGLAGGQIQRVDYLPELDMSKDYGEREEWSQVDDYEEADCLSFHVRPAVRLLFLDEQKNLLPKMETVWMVDAGYLFQYREEMVDNDNNPTWKGLMVKIFAPSEEAWEFWLENHV